MSLLGESFHACWNSPGAVLGDLVDASAWGIIVCISKIDTLGGWVCLVETWTVVKTILNTR